MSLMDKADADAGFVDLQTLVRYSGLSLRTIRKAMTDPVNPLPTHMVRLHGADRGRVLVSLREFDAWVRSFPPPGGARRTVDDPHDPTWIHRAFEKTRR